MLNSLNARARTFPFQEKRYFKYQYIEEQLEVIFYL